MKAYGDETKEVRNWVGLCPSCYILYWADFLANRMGYFAKPNIKEGKLMLSYTF